jgi:hypothetical protein
MKKSRKLIVISTSQVGVLCNRMKQANMSHGETILTDINNVTIARHKRSKNLAEAYFCRTNALENKKVITKGDGGDIPNRAVFENITLPRNKKFGVYNFKNVALTSNGSIQIHATATTILEEVLD